MRVKWQCAILFLNFVTAFVFMGEALHAQNSPPGPAKVAEESFSSVRMGFKMTSADMKNWTKIGFEQFIRDDLYQLDLNSENSNIHLLIKCYKGSKNRCEVRFHDRTDINDDGEVAFNIDDIVVLSKDGNTETVKQIIELSQWKVTYTDQDGFKTYEFKNHGRLGSMEAADMLLFLKCSERDEVCQLSLNQRNF